MTRQRKYQIDHEAQGLCRQCPNPAIGAFCEACREKARIVARNRYRRKMGIPLDSPLIHPGRPRVVYT